MTTTIKIEIDEDILEIFDELFRNINLLDIFDVPNMKYGTVFNETNKRIDELLKKSYKAPEKQKFDGLKKYKPNINNIQIKNPEPKDEFKGVLNIDHVI